MRITVDPHDRGTLVNPIEARIEVYLDGARMDRVITADEEEGMVVRHKVDSSGRLVISLDGKCAMTETLKGSVQVVIKPRGVSLQ